MRHKEKCEIDFHAHFFSSFHVANPRDDDLLSKPIILFFNFIEKSFSFLSPAKEKKKKLFLFKHKCQIAFFTTTQILGSQMGIK